MRMATMLAFLALLTSAVCGAKGPEAAREAGDGINSFGLELYLRLRSDGENIFFSPYSISTALAMTYAGAAGETAEEMRRALHFELEPVELHRAYADLIGRMNEGGEKGEYALEVANRLWMQQDSVFLQSFLSTVREFYRAEPAKADFRNNAESARLEINRWVADKTRDRIRDLLSRSDVDSMTRLVLVNAIYFKGKWLTEFDKKQTEEEQFTTERGDQVSVPMMRREGRMRYMENSLLQAVELPYKGNDLSMIVFLPLRAEGLAELEKELDNEAVERWSGELQHRGVQLFLPRFRLNTRFELGDMLQEMGMKRAFSDQADFSKMSEDEDLMISAVIHQAFVEVNEEGTEAAAATGVTMRVTAARPDDEPVIFRADHPFVFIIRDNASGSILFMGRVTNPGNQG